jgi:hypothetical protein
MVTELCKPSKRMNESCDQTVASLHHVFLLSSDLLNILKYPFVQ